MARILVVDDDRGVRGFVSRALELHGHDVRTAKDGADAVRTLDAHFFDIVLSDIRMPVMDGISLALKLKSEQPDLSVVLMTGYSDELHRAHNLSSLIDGVISKPFSVDALNALVRDLYAQSQLPGPAAVRPKVPASIRDQRRGVSSSQSGMSSSARSSSSD